MLSEPSILDAELLRAFAAFAEERNFTRAARRLGLSQPAFFDRIRRLSELLGIVLYRKEGRVLSLTAEGVRVAAFARESVERTSGFLRALRGESARETVVLAAGEGAYLYLLGPAISRFREASRGELTLLTLGGPTAVEAVLDGRAHVGVGVVDLPPRGLQSWELVKTPLCVAMARGHGLAKRKKVSLALLAGERLILPPEGQSHRAFVGRAFASIGAEVRAPIEADGWPLILRFAALGLGVAVVNGVCEPPEGVVLRAVPELGTVSYRAFVRRGAKLDAAAESLVEAVRETAREAIGAPL